MTATPWLPEYSVGHPVLDSQHRKLLGLCDRVAILVDDDSRESISQIHDVLNDLAVYAATHFRTEELLLVQCAYPHLHSQIAEHEDYQTHLAELLFEATQGTVLKVELHKFLAAWWIHHILESDRRYIGFLPASPA